MIPILMMCGSSELPLTHNSIRGSGDLISVLLNVDSFHSVNLATVAEDVNLLFGTEQSLEVTVDHNLLKFITTEVTGGVLTIGRAVPNDVKVTDQHLTVDITMSDLQSLTLEGVGTINADSVAFTADDVTLDLSGVGDMILDLDVNQLTTTQTGVGDIVLTGSANIHDVTMTGVGNLNAFEFATNRTTIVTSTVGDAEVQVHAFLDVTFNGAGLVYYKGRPLTINESPSGTGQLIDAN
jgi:hypothetical protein